MITSRSRLSKLRAHLFAGVVAVLLISCGDETSPPTATPAPISRPLNTPTALPTDTNTPAPTHTPTAEPTPTAIATRTPVATPTTTATPTSAPTPIPTASPTRTPVPTNMPSRSPLPTYEPTVTNTPTPTPTDTPARSPTHTLTPVPTVTPTRTPSPTPIHTPSPSPTSTPTAEELAAAHLSEIIPWFRNPPDDFSLEAAKIITDIWLRDAGLGDTVAPWLASGVTDNEVHALWHIHDIASTSIELARMMSNVGWLTDGVTENDRSALRAIREITYIDLELATMIVTLPWIDTEITIDEKDTLVALGNVAQKDLELASKIANASWFSHGPKANLGFKVLRSLSNLEGRAFSQLTTQPWVRDGLDDTEAALVVTIRSVAREPTLYLDLLQTHYTQTKTISLPLAGEVNIWVFQNDPFQPDEDLLTAIEDTARISEEFLGVPFPTTDIILLVVPQGSGIGGGHWGSHMVLRRFLGDIWNIAHETAHYYFHNNIGQT